MILSGTPRFMYILVRVLRFRTSSRCWGDSLVDATALTRPLKTRPLEPSTDATAPSFRTRVALEVPTTHGTPSSLLTIAAWLVMPPSSVTMPAVFSIRGT